MGIAGGFPKQKVHRGDVVVANVIHSFDYGKLIDSTFVRRPELDIVCDRGLLAYAEITASGKKHDWRDYIEEKRPDRKGVKTSVAHVDCYVASSDKVVDDPDHPFYAAVQSAFPEIHAVEMEGVGAGASARLAQIEGEAGFLMIRGISDEPGVKAAAGSGARKAWRSYASDVAAAFTRRFIEDLELPANNVQKGPSKSLDKRILNGDEPFLRKVSNAVQAKAPEFARLLAGALEAAEQAFSIADEGGLVAQRARTVLAKRLATLEIPEGKRRVLTADSKQDGMGRIGVVLWNSSDEYAGQVSQQTEDGLGEYKIYEVSRRFTPNRVSCYRGRMSGGKVGPLGVMEFPDIRTYAGRWVDQRPSFGYQSNLDPDQAYDHYFGEMGDFKDEKGHPIWVPHGQGVGISLKNRLVFYGSFYRGKHRGTEDEVLVLKPDGGRRALRLS